MADTFTPEQISQILEEFFRVVGTRQYIGARYVPIFGRKDEESIEWDNTAPYEPLTIVLYQGNSYTSRQYVPVGVEITNQEFWAITGNYNAQIEQYRRETAAVREVADNALAAANAAQTDIDTLLPKADFSAESTVKDYVDASVAVVQTDIDTLLPKADFSAENTVKEYIDEKFAESKNNVEFYPVASITPYLQYKIDASRMVQGGCIANDAYCFGAYHSNSATPAYLYLNSMNANVNRATNIDNKFGHCNDMTYNGNTNSIIVVGTDVGTAARWNIYELDATSLAIKNSYVPTVDIWSIAYDSERDCYYGIGSGHLYTFDTDFSVVATAEIDTSQTMQGICYADNKIYNLNSSSDSIDVLSLAGNLINKIPIAYRSTIIELEWLDFYDGDLYIGCASLNEPYLCVYKTSIADRNTQYLKYANDATVYVDYSATNLGSGLASNSPCACITAIDAIPFDKVFMHVTGETEFKNEYVFKNRTSLILQGSATFNKAVNFYYFDNVSFVDCTFTEYLRVNHCMAVSVLRGIFNYGTNQKNSLIAESCANVSCNTCTFNQSYPIYTDAAPVKVRNCTFNGSFGITSSVGAPQPYTQLYSGSEFSQQITVPLIKLYRAFIIEIHDPSDIGITYCLGLIKDSNPNQIVFCGSTNPGSANVRSVNGYFNITQNQTVDMTYCSYVKGTNTNNDYYVSGIYGLA